MASSSASSQRPDAIIAEVPAQEAQEVPAQEETQIDQDQDQHSLCLSAALSQVVEDYFDASLSLEERVQFVLEHDLINNFREWFLNRHGLHGREPFSEKNDIEMDLDLFKEWHKEYKRELKEYGMIVKEYMAQECYRDFVMWSHSGPGSHLDEGDMELSYEQIMDGDPQAEVESWLAYLKEHPLVKVAPGGATDLYLKQLSQAIPDNVRDHPMIGEFGAHVLGMKGRVLFSLTKYVQDDVEEFNKWLLQKHEMNVKVEPESRHPRIKREIPEPEVNSPPTAMNPDVIKQEVPEPEVNSPPTAMNMDVEEEVEDPPGEEEEDHGYPKPPSTSHPNINNVLESAAQAKVVFGLLSFWTLDS